MPEENSLIMMEAGVELAPAIDDSSKLRAMQVALLSSGHFLIDFYLNILLSIVPLLALDWKLSTSALGIMATTTSIITSFLQPVFGHMVDKYRRSWMLPLSVVWTAVGTCTIGFFPSFLMIIVLSVLGGLGGSFYHPIGSQYTTSIARHKKGLSMSAYSFGGNLGLAAAPLVIVPLIEAYGLPSISVMIIPALIFTIASYYSRINKVNPAAHSVGHIEDEGNGDTAEQSAARGYRRILLLNTVTGLRAWANTIIIVFVPTMFVLAGHTKMEGAKLLSAFFFVGVIGVVVFGYLADKMPIKRIIAGSTSIGALAAIGFFFLHGWAGISMLMVIAFVFNGTIPVTVIMAQGILPKNAGMASGLMMGFTFGIGSLGALLTGVLGDYIGIENAVATLVPIMIVAAILSWKLPNVKIKVKKNKENA